MPEVADSLATAAQYRHPAGSLSGRLIGALVDCPRWTALRRWAALRMPMPILASDVTDVVYMNWWLDVDQLPAPPAGYRYWVRTGHTPFTILTYRHGGFGPAAWGPLRRLLPSPLQSNWRWYLQREDEPPDAMPTVLFARNVMDSLPHVIGARLLSDAMQPHLAADFVHRIDADRIVTSIDPGQGSAPRMRAVLRDCDPAQVDATWWMGRFGSREQAWEFLACQKAALAIAPDGCIALTRIDLPVNIAHLRPLSVAVEGIECPLLGAMGGSAEQALCFLLPRVPFRVVSERLL
ncbi:hypothetical protein [Thermomonas haemolytica]|uniref:Uncharacterized protein n=1 Tax=Thermomonas haemolytica TaxID=141949 RepID=A0A4R3NA03_9GAMM|nr:hypothetical protein [Thermomonas haemolytica]TCT26075.1 hypothetical protein EDC34_101402 [Thermomonas haemolytica]TNY28641.1 hypothetical protein BV505_09520 [Thermomonas haemolytica]